MTDVLGGATSTFLSSPYNYLIPYSLRFRGSSSNLTFFQRIITSNAASFNNKNWTFSTWLKYTGQIDINKSIFSMSSNTGTGASGIGAWLSFNSSDRALRYTHRNWDTSTVLTQKISTSYYKDPSAWYNIILLHDFTNPTASDRVRLFINGKREASFTNSTDAPYNTASNLPVGANLSFKIGCHPADLFMFSGYMTEINFVEGTTANCATFSNNTIVFRSGNTDNIGVGFFSSGNGVATDTLVTEIVNSTTLRISNNATATANGITMGFSPSIFNFGTNLDTTGLLFKSTGSGQL